MAPPDPSRDIAPFARLGPDRPATPLVVAVPHAGRHYPAAIERDRAVGWPTLELLEDRYADRLIGPVLAEGAICLVATYARAWIDLNRAETEIASTSGAESQRSRAGLGLVPSRLGGRPLWREAPAIDDVLRRIAAIHRPYHAAIAGAIAAARAAFGYAVLIDCHSMPSLAPRSGTGARIVIGDRHGTSAGPAVSQAALAAAAAAGLSVARNVPYAGAHALERHGRPQRDVHALQIEIDRALYLAPTTNVPAAAGLAAMGALLARIGWACVATAVTPVADAAE